MAAEQDLENADNNLKVSEVDDEQQMDITNDNEANPNLEDHSEKLESDGAQDLPGREHEQEETAEPQLQSDTQDFQDDEVNAENEPTTGEATQPPLSTEQGEDQTDDDQNLKVDSKEMENVEAKKAIEPEYIKVKVKSQFQEKLVTVDASANVEQLRSLVAVKYNVSIEQVCLTLDGKMLNNDSEDLKHLNIVDNTLLHMAVKFNLNDQPDPTSASMTSPWFLPSQYTKLGLNNVNFVSLQQQMQEQMMANPEMVREMMTNPLVQQLMRNPEVMKKMMMQVPQTREMLTKHPDIFDALNNPDIMKQSLDIAQDPIALKEMLDKMEIPENSPYVNAVPTFNPQPIPTPQTMLRMTAQHPKLLQQMFDSPYYKSMVDGMIGNPQWTQQMIVNNPLFSNNPQMQQQISSLMPYYLQQMQNPQLTSLMRNPDSLKALLKIQHGVSVLQSEAPNLSQSMGFPNIGIPGLMNSHENISSSGNNGLASDYVGGARGGKDQLDATSIVMSQLVDQMGSGKIDLPAEEKYKDELDLMGAMGFDNVDVNLELLKRTFGNVDAAVTHLIQQQQFEHTMA